MLYDRDRSKISERAQHQIEKTGIQKISALGVAKIGTGQFAQSGREIAPGIRIGNWSEWRLKALRLQSNSKAAKPNLFPAGATASLRAAQSFQGAAQPWGRIMVYRPLLLVEAPFAFGTPTFARQIRG